MTGFSPEEIQAARALVDAATPAPWITWNDGNVGCAHRVGGIVMPTPGSEPHRHQHMPDARFIAAARSLVPRLLDALEQAQAERDAEHVAWVDAERRWSQANSDARRAGAAVMAARKAALHEAADWLVDHMIEDDPPGEWDEPFNNGVIWAAGQLTARADAQGSTP